MDSNLKLGLSKKSEQIVQDTDTAKALGSGRAEVFATPCMIALMENAAYSAVQPALAQGQSTVGTGINAKHLAVTPIGLKVWAVATLCEIDRRKLTFTIEAHDETELIGTAVHVRFIIDEEKFADRANRKAK
jgi:fluoroacetyl-CoA thioesterase